MKILVTGGAGYIGSHTCVELLNAGYDVVVMDNLYNASEKAIERVEQITGKKVTFYKTDMLDREGVKKIFDNEKIDAVIHFAGLKAVGESVHKPIEYYHNNMTGTLILCDEMRNHGVKNIIFSSSATVYGNPAQINQASSSSSNHCSSSGSLYVCRKWRMRQLECSGFTSSLVSGRRRPSSSEESRVYVISTPISSLRF